MRSEVLKNDPSLAFITFQETRHNYLFSFRLKVETEINFFLNKPVIKENHNTLPLGNSSLIKDRDVDKTDAH